MYKGLMDKDNGEGWVGRWRVMGGKMGTTVMEQQ